MPGYRGEINVRDVIAWAPSLTLLHEGPGTAGSDPLDRDIDWVVTARSHLPMLPPLRGAELVIMPQHISQESGIPLAMLLHELSNQPVAGVIVDREMSVELPPPLPVLQMPIILPDLESELNRLLTTRRGDLLRAAADLEHTISELAIRNVRPGELIEALSAHLKIGIIVASDNGAILFSTANQSDVRHPFPGEADRRDQRWLHRPLQGQRTLWIGPVQPDQRAYGRLVAHHVREGIQRSIDQAAPLLPHGTLREQSLNTLLLEPDATPMAHRVTSAMRAGLPVDGKYRVALVPLGQRQEEVRRRIVSYGSLHDAGMIDGFQASIVVASSVHARTVQVSGTLSGEPRGIVAVSAPVESIRQLPEAVRQARYLAALQHRQLIQRAEIAFDDLAHVGVFRLLYNAWGSPELQRYVDQTVGQLLREDRRGILTETLRIYLEQGGAQQATAARLGIHRNTLRYRLQQLRPLVSIDPDDPHGRISLHLALVAAALPPPPPIAPAGSV